MPTDAYSEAHDLRLRHDNDLKAMDNPMAQVVLDARTRGAAFLRAILARAYGHTKAATAQGWHIVPHATAIGTIGVVNVADGTAWDLGVRMTEDVDALGLDDSHTPDANHPSLAGDVRFEGELVQRQGETPGAPIRAPEGWMRIGLTTWRGFPVPEKEYVPEETWIRPQLVAFGLTTCYGHPGRPRRMFGDAAGHGGRRPWIHPQHESTDPSWWPMDEAHRVQIRRMAIDWLDSLIGHLMEMAGYDEDSEVAEALRTDATDGPPLLSSAGPGVPAYDSRILRAIDIATPGRPSGRRDPNDPARVLAEAVSAYDGYVVAVWRVLRAAGVLRVGAVSGENVSGARRVDLAAALLSRVLTDRLTDTAMALGEIYQPLYVEDDHGASWEGSMALKRQIGRIAEDVGARLLAGRGESARALIEEEMVARYYEMRGAPVLLDQPAHEH